MPNPAFSAFAARLLAIVLTAFWCGTGVCAEAPQPVFDCRGFMASLQWVSESGSLLCGTYGECTSDTKFSPLWSSPEVHGKIRKISGLDKQAICTAAVDTPGGISPVYVKRMGGGRYFVLAIASESMGGWLLDSDDMSSKPVSSYMSLEAWSVAFNPGATLGAIGLRSGGVITFKIKDISDGRITPIAWINLGKSAIERLAVIGENAWAAADWQGNLWKVGANSNGIRVQSRYQLAHVPSCLLPIGATNQVFVTDCGSTYVLCLDMGESASTCTARFPLDRGDQAIMLPDHSVGIASRDGVTIWKLLPRPREISYYDFKDEFVVCLAAAPELKCLFVGTLKGKIYSIPIP